MKVQCPVCQTEYDLEPGKYKCECGATFLVEDPNEATETFAPPDDDPNKTIAPRHHADFDPAGDQTMPGKRDRKPDGYFEPGEMILNRYKVLGSLGRGGMGVVYKCFDEVGGIEIALKALPPELSHDEEEMEDIKANFQIVSKLVHQNICISKNLEKDNANGNYYLIMECVEGEDLRRWIRREKKDGKLTLENILPLIRQVADALDYAHEQKIIHRDIKPGNIMVDSAGHVKVLDFGLAAQIHTSMTRVSMAYHGTSGTATYMAPEQWRGQAQGAAADQYALAAMTYEMLAGHLPFEGSDPTILREAVLNDNPAPIAGIPSSVQKALDKGLSKKPEDRFATCADFVSGLTSKKKTKLISKKFLLKILMSLMIVSCLGGVSYLGYWGYGKIQSTREKIRIEKEEKERQKREREAARLAEEKRKEQERLRAERQAQIRAELAAKREKERIEAQIRQEKYNRELEQKRKEAELAEKKRTNKINEIYEKMFREITLAFEKAKKQAQVNYQNLSEEKQSRIEAVEKKQNDEIAGLKNKIAAWEQQKKIPEAELDKMFPLYKEGDQVIIPTKRYGTVRGTLYAIRSNTITVNSVVIARMDIPPELIEPSINAQKRNLERNRRQSKFNYLIRLAENKIQDIEKSYQREKNKIEREVSNAEKAVTKLEYGKNRAYDMLRKHRDEANRYKLLTIKPVDYNQIIKDISAEGEFQWSGNAEIDNSVTTSEANKPSDDSNASTSDPYKFNSLIFYAPLEQEESELPTGQKITVHGNVSYTEIDGIKCASFDGKSMLSFGKNHILGNSPCTMCIWVYSISNDSGRETAFVIGRQTRESKRDLVRYLKRLNFEGFYSGNIYSNAPLRNQWSCVAFTYDGRNCQLYRNGQLTGSSQSTLNTQTDQISIGALMNVDGGIAQTWKGYLSHARIYNRCLSQQEISQLATELTPGKNRDFTSDARTSESKNHVGTKIITLPNNIKLEMVRIPAGSFMMGSPSGEFRRFSSRENMHRVTITKDYWMSRYEITQEQYAAIMGNNPSKFRGSRLPVEQVTWINADTFCKKMNEFCKEGIPPGYQFDLPTEAEWEYACRAGTTTCLNNGQDIFSDQRSNAIDEVAWYSRNSNMTTHEVGLKKPNAWGLYDMQGNVSEWCCEWSEQYSGNQVDPITKNSRNKSLRSGAYFNDPRHIRQAFRHPVSGYQDLFSKSPTNSGNNGIRLVLVPLRR